MMNRTLKFISLATITCMLASSLELSAFAQIKAEKGVEELTTVQLEKYTETVSGGESVSEGDSELTAALTCYEDGSFSPVTSDGKYMYANGTNLIFQDDKMYQDFEPYGELDENDKRIFTEPYLDDSGDIFNGKNDMSLEDVYIFTGGETDKEYGDCRITIRNSTIRGIFVNHTKNTIVDIKNSDVTRHYIANATGDVDYTIDSNTGTVANIDFLDTVTDSVTGKNAGLVEGNLNLTLNNVKNNDNVIFDILASGTVLGNTNIYVNNSKIHNIKAAHNTGSATQPGWVNVYINDSTIEDVRGVSGGFYGEAATVNGGINVEVKNSQIKFGVSDIVTRSVYTASDGIEKYRCTVTESGSITVENSTMQFVRDTTDKFGLGERTQNTNANIKNSEIDNVTSDNVHLYGNVIGNIDTSYLYAEENACLTGGAYVESQLNGKLIWQSYDDSQFIIGKDGVLTLGAEVKIVPVKKTDGGYVPYGKTEVLQHTVEVKYLHPDGAASQISQFTCDYGKLKVVEGDTYSKIQVVSYQKKIAATKIKLSKSKVTINKGKTLTLKATLTPKNSTDTIKWTSSNIKVATVSSKGKITAVKKGTATITAKTSSGKKATCKVTVKEIKSTKIKLNKTKATIKKGKSLTLKATLTPKNSTDTIKWTTSNKKVAKVSAKGKVTAMKKGTATITAKTSSGKKVACKITVK